MVYQYVFEKEILKGKRKGNQENVLRSLPNEGKKYNFIN